MGNVRLAATNSELTIMRRLSSIAYGTWEVTWPDDFDEAMKPKIDGDRKFGYVSRLSTEAGRMGRRFIRADIAIKAADLTDGGFVPNSGHSNTEAVLDAAGKHTTGRAVIEREISREGLLGSQPGVDFAVGDTVDVVLWDRVVALPVTAVEAVTDAGAVVDWRIRVGGDLLSDAGKRRAANAEIERAIIDERRKRDKEVEESARRVTAKLTQQVEAKNQQLVKTVEAKNAQLVEAKAQELTRSLDDRAQRLSRTIDSKNAELAQTAERRAAGVELKALAADRKAAEADRRALRARNAAEEADQKAIAADLKAIQAVADALKADNRAKAAAFAADEADAKAVEAGRTATRARTLAQRGIDEIQGLIVALAGVGADRARVDSDLSELNRQLQQRGEGSGTQGLIRAYINSNTARWALQKRIDDLQNRMALENRSRVVQLEVANRRLADMQMALQKQQLSEIRGILPAGYSDQYGSFIRSEDDGYVEFTAKGNWRGEVILSTDEYVERNERAGDGFTDDRYTKLRHNLFKIPMEDGSRRILLRGTAIDGMAYYTVRPGSQRLEEFPLRGYELDKGMWTTLNTINVPGTLSDVTMYARVEWDAAAYAEYGIRIVKGGRTLVEERDSALGPFFALTDGRRSMSVTVTVPKAQGVGDYRIDVFSEASLPKQRATSGGLIRVSRTVHG